MALKIRQQLAGPQPCPGEGGGLNVGLVQKGHSRHRGDEAAVSVGLGREDRLSGPELPTEWPLPERLPGTGLRVAPWPERELYKGIRNLGELAWT